MDVRLIAFTTFNDNAVDDLVTWTDEHIDERRDADMLAEFAGRLCYMSYGRANAKTRRTVDYIKNILRQNHYSVLEHASVTFLVRGVSRTLTHELVRHRHLSFSQLSQRYVDESTAVPVIPPLLADVDDVDGQWLVRQFSSMQNLGHQLYDRVYAYLMAKGHSHKEARGAARAVLIANTNTSIVVSGNLRAWLDFLGKRWHVAADAEIRALAGELLPYLCEIAPATFQDVPTTPYGS